MTASTRRVIIVVPHDLRGQGNTRADEVAEGEGLPTFSVPLVDAQGDVKAYWCSWQVTEQQWDRLQRRFANPGFERLDVRWFDGDEWTPDQVLADVGLQRPVSDEP